MACLASHSRSARAAGTSEKFKSHCGSRFGRQEDAADEAQDDDRERSDEPAISEVVITLVSARPMAEKAEHPSTV